MFNLQYYKINEKKRTYLSKSGCVNSQSCFVTMWKTHNGIVSNDMNRLVLLMHCNSF